MRDKHDANSDRGNPARAVHAKNMRTIPHTKMPAPYTAWANKSGINTPRAANDKGGAP
jgi:hypothetical protein